MEENSPLIILKKIKESNDNFKYHTEEREQ